MCRTRGSKVAKVRNLLTHLVKEIEVKLNTRLVSDSKKMKNTVRAASKRHIARESVLDRLLVDYVSRADILLNELHNSHTCMLCKHCALTAYGRNSSVSGKCYTDSLAQTVHTVSGVHTCTASASGARARLTLGELALVNNACLISANRLKEL